MLMGLVALWLKGIDNHKIEDLAPGLTGIQYYCVSTLISMMPIPKYSYHLRAKGRIVVLKILSHNGVPVGNEMSHEAIKYNAYQG